MRTLLLISLFGLILCTPLRAYDPNGLWYAEIENAMEVTEALDIWQQVGETLYVLGWEGCGTNGLIALDQLGPDHFGLSSTFECSFSGISLTVERYDLYLLSNDLASIEMAASVRDYTFSATITAEKLPASPLSPNQALKISDWEDNKKAFFVEVPEGARGLEVRTTGGWGDCDLALLHGYPRGVFLESSDVWTEERIFVPYPISGRWYIVVDAFEDYGDVTLEVRVEGGESPGGAGSPAGPLADIRANYSDGDLYLWPGDTLHLTLRLEPGPYLGRDADWWFVLVGPSGIYHYDGLLGTFRPGLAPSYQGSLFSFPPLEIFRGTLWEWAPGDYSVYFGVDLRPNGTVDLDQAFYDVVHFTIIP